MCTCINVLPKHLKPYTHVINKKKNYKDNNLTVFGNA